jgi:hypothetical protein
MEINSSIPFWAASLYYAIVESPIAGWQAIGKVVRDITLTSDTLPNWTFEDWGYGRNKITQLTRNYVNEEEFERVRSVLKRRSEKKYTSVALSLRGKPKDSRSQGWCMLSLVISRNGTSQSVEVQYRTTEAILKFAADVIFLRDYLLRWLDLSPDVFRFRFANCALSGAYFPYLVDKLDIVKFLERVHRRDPEFFLRTTRFLLKASYRKDQYHPFSPERVSHKFLWGRASTAQIKAIRAYLEPLHAATGRPLPKDFHDESYVPKGQRARQIEETGDE